MPPRELPGLYFDVERNRYFPLSSRPKPTAPAPTPARSVQTAEGPSRKRRKFDDALSDSGPSRLNLSRFGASVNNVKFSHKGTERRHGMHDLIAAQYERTAHSTLEMTRIGKGAYITSLSPSPQDDSIQIMGDSSGFVHLRCSPRALPDAHTGETYGGGWHTNLGLLSPITSTAIVDDKFFATSFGPSPKVLIGTLDVAGSGAGNADPYGDFSENTCIIEPRNARDVRTASFDKRSFVLGMARCLMYVPDTENVRTARMIPTSSDVMALHRHRAELITGARNGLVHIYDLREAVGGDGRGVLRATSSVTNIQKVREWEMMVTAMNGDIDIYDLRFLRTCTLEERDPDQSSKQKQTKPSPNTKSHSGHQTNPVLSLTGHVCSYMHNLPIALDPTHDFVFAAGQDRIVRAWSTRTGAQLVPPNSPTARAYMLDKTFPHQVLGLHVSDSSPTGEWGDNGHGAGLAMWVGSGPIVERFQLGRMA